MINEYAEFSLSLSQILQLRIELRNSMSPVLKEHDLSLETWMILVTLSEEKEGITLSELTKIQGGHMSGLSKHVDTLSQRALLYRHQDTIDRRTVKISISANGKELLKKMNISLKGIKKDFDKKFPKQTRKNLKNITRNI